ncbi:MAG: molybdenum cofactor biosynthesis protein MoaE [Alphaproteobacteria bacterium GM7ARS4]|nr:molybdenum cofactor biosynthesis protein MoaE [Alphaproteobacteria bacterium GM7ARS4]
MVSITLQSSPIDVGSVYGRFADSVSSSGAVAMFVGRMRASCHHQGRAYTLRSMTLEHYHAMAQRQLDALASRACARWTLEDICIVHRYGKILPHEVIVFIATGAEHRQPALEACHFLIDWLKVKAPFWKYEETNSGEGFWVAAQNRDEQQANGWHESTMPHTP